MKRLSSHHAFTLLELIVSMGLVSVIVLGIFSINTVLTNNNQDFGQRYLVRSETQIALNHIVNNASLAYGSGNTNDEPILIGQAQVGDPDTFCIHQCGVVSGCGTGSPGQNIINSNTDIWLCYTQTASGEVWCAEQYNGAAADPRGAGSCLTSGTIIPNPATGANTTFLGSVYYVATSYTPTVGFTVKVLNCLNNGAGSCNMLGTSTDPTNNPEVQLSQTVFPQQAST